VTGLDRIVNAADNPILTGGPNFRRITPASREDRTVTLDKAKAVSWPEGGVTRVPYGVYSDPELYALEQRLIFRGPVWNFLGLEIELPAAGDYRTTFVGETPVIVTRDENGDIHAMVNRCAHKGALVCPKERGNAASLTCVYHSWTYDLRGKLEGVAFRKGVRGHGGMPADFDPGQRGLEPLRVEIFCGLIFGTFSDETEPFEAYIGDAVGGFMKRNLNRPLRLLGGHSQMLHNNWKLYAENLRDSYHATLLHTFYSAFKINRLDMDGGITLSEKGWHHISYAKRATLIEDKEYEDAKVHAAKFDSALAGPRLLESWDEFDDGITHSIQTIFPTSAVQFILNSLAFRFFVPRGIDKTELFWIYLGYADDTEEQTRMRVMQSNLTGAAGLVSLEDGCINEFVQRGVRGSESQSSFMEMGGRDVASSAGSRATEAAVRGFWQGYRGLMGIA
jgi:phenylpropionate dioxygenase-like ring-hydroxylating dioxygenase large terminal subunit